MPPPPRRRGAGDHAGVSPARLADYLLRRGYPAATVRHAVRVLLAERGADLSGIEEDGGA